LKEEEELCTGKGLAVEELNAKEQEMRSTLKKLLLLQTTGSEGAPKKKENKSENEKPKAADSDKPLEIPKPSVSAEDVAAHCNTLVSRIYGLVEQCERVGALSSTLCDIRNGLEQYMKQVQQWIGEQWKKHDEFVEKEKDLRAKCEEAERKNQILRGDDDALKGLSAEEVTKYTDYVMEAVGQVAVAKYKVSQKE